MPRSAESDTGIGLPVESVAVALKSGAASPIDGNFAVGGAGLRLRAGDGRRQGGENKGSAKHGAHEQTSVAVNDQCAEDKPR